MTQHERHGVTNHQQLDSNSLSCCIENETPLRLYQRANFGNICMSGCMIFIEICERSYTHPVVYAFVLVARYSTVPILVPTRCMWFINIFQGCFTDNGLIASFPKHLRPSPTGHCNLTHWGQVTHNAPIILPLFVQIMAWRRPGIIWSNAGISLIGPLGTNLSEILIKLYIMSFTKMQMKKSSVKWQPFCFSLNMLTTTKHNKVQTISIFLRVYIQLILLNWLYGVTVAHITLAVVLCIYAHMPKASVDSM